MEDSGVLRAINSAAKELRQPLRRVKKNKLLRAYVTFLKLVIPRAPQVVAWRKRTCLLVRQQSDYFNLISYTSAESN